MFASRSLGVQRWVRLFSSAPANNPSSRQWRRFPSPALASPSFASPSARSTHQFRMRFFSEQSPPSLSISLDLSAVDAPAAAAAEADSNACPIPGTAPLSSSDSGGRLDFVAMLDDEVQRVEKARGSYFEVLEKAAAGRLADEALELITNMRGQNVPLDIHVYNAGLAACSEDMQKFDQLRTEMRDEAIDVNLANLAITTRACEHHGFLDMAFVVQRDLLKLCRTTRASALQDIIEAKVQLAKFDISPPAVMYDALIRRMLDEGNTRHAYVYVQEMVEKNIKFAFSTIEAVITTCEMQGLDSEADFLKEMVTPELLLNALSEDASQIAAAEVEKASKDRTMAKQAFYALMAEIDPATVIKTPVSTTL